MIDFWSNVKALLKGRKATQDWLASECNVSSGTLKNQVARNILPSVDIALRIACALGVSVEYLVTGEEGEGLTAEERALLEAWRDAEKAIRMGAMDMLEASAERERAALREKNA